MRAILPFSITMALSRSTLPRPSSALETSRMAEGADCAKHWPNAITTTHAARMRFICFMGLTSGAAAQYQFKIKNAKCVVGRWSLVVGHNDQRRVGSVDILVSYRVILRRLGRRVPRMLAVRRCHAGISSAPVAEKRAGGEYSSQR